MAPFDDPLNPEEQSVFDHTGLTYDDEADDTQVIPHPYEPADQSAFDHTGLTDDVRKNRLSQFLRRPLRSQRVVAIHHRRQARLQRPTSVKRVPARSTA